MGPSKPSQVAKVIELATDCKSTDGISANEPASSSIIGRIKKCLERASHPGTPEAEAKAALRMSSRLMAQFNVTHADVISHTNSEERLRFAGQSVVGITSTKGEDKRVIMQTWADIVAGTMTTFFDCKLYSIHHSHTIKWT